MMSSTSLAFISDSMRPTSAMAKACGAIVIRASRERHVGQARNRQRGRQVTLVAHGRHRDSNTVRVQQAAGEVVEIAGAGPGRPRGPGSLGGVFK